MLSNLIGLASLAFVAGFGAPEQEHPASQDNLPHLGFSIAEPARDRIVQGPRFQRFRQAVDAAIDGDGSGFAAFLNPGADLKLTVGRNPGPVTVPFSAATIRAIAASCVGPYSHTERADWAQLSWICRTDGIGPLARTLTFEYTSELSVTVWFEGQGIRRIDADEPLSIPMARRPSMDAYEYIRRNQGNQR